MTATPCRLIALLALLCLLFGHAAARAEDTPATPVAEEAPAAPAVTAPAPTAPVVVPPVTVAPPAAVKPAAPRAPAPAPVATGQADELERLVGTLEDGAAREVLIGQLKAMIAAQRATRDEVESSLMGRVSQQVGAFGDQAMAAIDSIRDAPELANAVGQRLADQLGRQRLGQMLLTLAGILVAGIATDRIAVALIRRWRKRHRVLVPATDIVGTARTLIGRLIRDLLPLAVFAAVGWGAMTLLGLSGKARQAMEMVLLAYGSVRLVMVGLRLALSSRSPLRRVVPLDDETAEYIQIWAGRITAVGMFAPVAASVPGLLGMPSGAAFLTLKVIGLAMTVMVVILILQNRRLVAQALRRPSEQPMFGRHVQRLRARLADVWHVLAILWVVAIYLVWAVQVKGGFEFMLRATILTVVILVVAAAVSSLLRRMIERGFAVSQEVREKFPLLEARANRYLPALHVALRSAVALITLLALAQTWGLDSLRLLSSSNGRQVLSSLISISVVLVTALIIWEVLNGMIERYLTATDSDGNQVQRSSRARTLLPLVRNLVMIVMVVMVTLIVLSELGVNIAPLLAGAGVLGIAIGFGSQKLVQDMITGAFILFEDTIAVGDSVKLGEHSGTVEAISIRAIRLRDLTGGLHTVPFGAVTTVVNTSRGFSFALFDVDVAYGEDTDRVCEVLKEIGTELQADAAWSSSILEPIDVQGVQRFDSSSVVIRARIKTQPDLQYALGREFNRRMKQRFDALGIEIPFPQTKVWLAGPETKG